MPDATARLRRPLALAGVGALVLGAAAITITPSSHDFGKVDIDVLARGPAPSQAFTIALPPGAPPGSFVMVTLTGPNAVDFILTRHVVVVSPLNPANTVGPQRATSIPIQACSNSTQGSVCSMDVDFVPWSLGLKTASLVVTDSRGNTGSAVLKGEGVGGVCEARLVWCNYAHLYSGSFIWKSSVSGPASQSDDDGAGRRGGWRRDV